MNQFPSKAQLWARYIAGKGFDARQERILTEPDHYDIFTQKKPRYYQRIAISNPLEVIGKGNDCILLVMATGTGKTFTAFQIIWKLLRTNIVKSVLYLADQNILIDQTKQQDCHPFEKIMTKVKDRKLDRLHEIYISIYQQLAGDDGSESFRQFQPNFFGFGCCP